MDFKKIFNILPIKSGRISMLNYRNAVKIQYQVLQNHLFVKFSHGSTAPTGKLLDVGAGHYHFMPWIIWFSCF